MGKGTVGRWPPATAMSRGSGHALLSRTPNHDKFACQAAENAKPLVLAAPTRPSFLPFRNPLQMRGRREDRVPAGTRGPSREKVAQRARRPQVEAENTPAFPARMVYGLFRALLGEPMLDCHRRLAQAFGASAETWRQRRGAGTTRLRRPQMCRSSVGPFTSIASRAPRS